MPKSNSKKPTKHILHLRTLEKVDYEAVREILQINYPTDAEPWTRDQFERLIKIFPEGQICVEDQGKVVAYALSLIVNYDDYGDDHTYRQITGNHTFNTHTREGDVLYGIDVCVNPEFKGLRLGRRLYDARKEICESLNLKSIIAGGRMPKYKEYSDRMSPREFIEKVKRKEIFDPVLSFQISNDFHVKKVLKNYAPYDIESKTHATLIEWNNVYYVEKEKKMHSPTRNIVRLGVVQWQMRNTDSLESLCDNIEFFVDAVSDYQADFILFPELFNAPLMKEYNHLGMAGAIKKLAEYTEPIRNQMIKFALSYNINIIAGSMPVEENGHLYNVAYLCRRDGTWEEQKKIHITPNEYDSWSFQSGDKIKVFDTDVARIGINICYDVEFPELARLMSEQGMQILFVPYLTDIKNGFERVRKCAQARAIENECYVAIAGSVGNLPKVKNMDIQFGESAVYSPCDIAFPHSGVISAATENTEMTILADIDLDLLKDLHNHGSVRNLKDRRKDLYELNWLSTKGATVADISSNGKVKTKKAKKEVS